MLHEFDGAGGGGYTYSGLIQATDGNFYGTTNTEGANSAGIVFKLEPSGNFSVLHTFDGAGGGGSPYGGLIQASDGNLYGTTQYGGVNGFGTVFKLDLSGNFTVLYEFEANINKDGNYGASPQGSLIQAIDGSLYGTTTLAEYDSSVVLGTVYKIDVSGHFTHLVTLDGMSNDGLIQGSDGNFYITIITSYGSTETDGSVYKMDSSGTLSLLHKFTGGSGGADPYAPLIQGNDGRLYGTTARGGFGFGTVFQLDLSGNFQVMHEFEGIWTPNPTSLMQASDGSFYSTTTYGGNYGFGAVFKWDTLGNVSIVHSFDGYTEGAFPYAALIQGSDGNLYGATSGGYLDVNSLYYAYSTLFKIDPAGNFSVLHTFNELEGLYIVSELLEADDGNFYGTAYYGGSKDYGIVFKLDPSSNTVTVLHEFDGVGGGANPSAGLTQGADGSFYGTTEYGGNKEGTSGAGTIYKIDSSGNFSTLHEFDGDKGAYPNTPLIQGSDGSFYGGLPEEVATMKCSQGPERSTRSTLPEISAFCMSLTELAADPLPTD